MDGDNALRQIGHGLNNLHSALLAHQTASEKRWANTDAKLDRHYTELYAKLTEVCDRGRQEHKHFDDSDAGLQEQIHTLSLRMTEYEARNKGRADILKPIFGWASKRAGIIVFALYVGWDQFVAPLVLHPPPAAARIDAAL